MDFKHHWVVKKIFLKSKNQTLSWATNYSQGFLCEFRDWERKAGPTFLHFPDLILSEGDAWLVGSCWEPFLTAAAPAGGCRGQSSSYGSTCVPGFLLSGLFSFWNRGWFWSHRSSIDKSLLCWESGHSWQNGELEIYLGQLLRMCWVASLGQASRHDSKLDRPGLGAGERDTKE